MSDAQRPPKELAPLASAALLFGLLFASSAVPPPFGSPKLAFFLAFLLDVVLVAAISSLRRTTRAWLRVGELDRRAWGWTALAALVSAVALVGYDRLVHPDVADLRAQLPALGPTGLVLFGLGLSIVNAVSEEVVFRGVLQHALETELGAGALALGLQAVLFGMPHVGGYPRGGIGLGLTTSFGLLMGLLRARTKGLLHPCLAHLVADLTIFALVTR